MKKTKKSSRKKSARKLSKKASAYTKKRRHGKMVELLPDAWVMPFNASFPRENSVDFILDEDDEDRAVIFQFDGEFDE